MTERIKATYGTAYYANTYQKLQTLKKEGILKIETTGNSSNVNLNFQSYQLVNSLAAMEIEKKIDALSNREDLFTLFNALDTVFNNASVKSAIAVKATDTIKLNRIDLLFLGKNPNYHKETIELYGEILKVQNKYNIKINNLIVDKISLANLCASTEINPLREALSDKIILFGSQAFWVQIKKRSLKQQRFTQSSKKSNLQVYLPMI